MTVGSTGFGGSSMHLPPSNTDRFNSFDVNSKNAIALIADSLKLIDISFVEHRSYQLDNRNPSRPTISHPMNTMRMGSDTYEPGTEDLEGKFQSLIDILPPDVQGWMAEEAKLPFTERDPNFFVLQSLIGSTANGLVNLDNMSEAKPPDHPIFMRASDNLLVPYVATKTTIEQGKESLVMLQGNWNEIGRNDPHFDQNINYIGQTADCIEQLESAIKGLAQDPPAPGAMASLKKVSAEIDQLKEQYHATSAGSNLTILGNIIDTLALTASALQVGFGPASVLWMSAFGTLHTNDSAIKGASTKLSGAWNLDTGQKALLGSALQMLFTLTPALVLGIANHGLPHLSSANQSELISLILSTTLLFHSQVLQNTANAIAEKVTPDVKEQKSIANVIVLSTLLVGLMSLENKSGFAEPFFSALSPELGHGIDKVLSDLENSPNLNNVKIYLEQAKIALDNQNYNGFKEAYQELLTSFNIPLGALQGEMGSINLTSSSVMQAYTAGSSESDGLSTAIHAA